MREGGSEGVSEGVSEGGRGRRGWGGEEKYLTLHEYSSPKTNAARTLSPEQGQRSMARPRNAQHQGKTCQIRSSCW